MQVLFSCSVLQVVVDFFGMILLLRTPFGRALTSSLIEPLVLRLPASERWRAMRRGWVWVLCGFFVIPRAICERREPNGRSDSKLEQARSACGCEEAAATAWRPAGKGHSDSVVPPAVVECFFGVIRLLRLPATLSRRA